MSDVKAEIGLIHGSGFVNVYGVQLISTGSRLNAEKGAQLLSDGTVERVICSGRGPVQGSAYQSTEARMMADELVKKGVSHKAIELEENSTSAVGNWSNSAPIIHELGAASVLGVAARTSVLRMGKIGGFVAARSGFEVAGYVPSDFKPRIKDYGRELIMMAATRQFLNASHDTPIEDLAESYEKYKSALGLNTIKGFLHRGLASPTG